MLDGSDLMIIGVLLVLSSPPFVYHLANPSPSAMRTSLSPMTVSVTPGTFRGNLAVTVGTKVPLGLKKWTLVIVWTMLVVPSVSSTLSSKNIL